MQPDTPGKLKYDESAKFADEGGRIVFTPKGFILKSNASVVNMDY